MTCDIIMMYLIIYIKYKSCTDKKLPYIKYTNNSACKKTNKKSKYHATSKMTTKMDATSFLPNIYCLLVVRSLRCLDFKPYKKQTTTGYLRGY